MNVRPTASANFRRDANVRGLESESTGFHQIPIWVQSILRAITRTGICVHPIPPDSNLSPIYSPRKYADWNLSPPDSTRFQFESNLIFGIAPACFFGKRFLEKRSHASWGGACFTNFNPDLPEKTVLNLKNEVCVSPVPLSPLDTQTCNVYYMNETKSIFPRRTRPASFFCFC